MCSVCDAGKDHIHVMVISSHNSESVIDVSYKYNFQGTFFVVPLIYDNWL